MAVKYITAAIPEPATILGVRLKDFCIAHIRSMSRYGCGFASDEETNVGIDDLILALAICSMSGGEFDKCFSDNSIEIEAKRYKFFLFSFPFIEQITYKKRIPFYEPPTEYKNSYVALFRYYFPKEPKSYLGKWGYEVRKQIKKDSEFNILEKFSLFDKYRKSATRTPKVWNKNTGGGSTPPADDCLEGVLQTLMKCGYTKEEALQLPLAQAFYDYYLFLAYNGAVEFVSKEHQTIMDKITAMKEAACQT